MSSWLRIGVCSCLLWLGACSGPEGVVCEDTERYSKADSIPPVRVPDDLTLPDESETLAIPGGGSRAPSARADQSCLEMAPPFFDDEAADDG